MAKYENNKKRYQVGDYWISKQSRSPAWCRTWFDPKSHQTRRASLGTADFAEAKQALDDWFVLHQQKKDLEPKEALLSELFARYYEHYGKNLKSVNLVRLSLCYWLDFYGEKTVSEAANITEQERFHSWLIHTKGLKPNSANRIVSYGKAAISWTWKRGEISQLPYFLAVKNIGIIPPRGRPLEIKEVALLLEQAISPHLKDFIVMMIATASRPDAILDLTFDRCDFDNGLLILNPVGRVQTKKYRPTVKMPEAVMPYLARLMEKSDSPYVISYRGKQIKSLKTAWKLTRTKAKLDDQVNPYSLRHTMARHLRRSSVPAWEVSAQLGHKTREASTTEIYAPFDPTYLSKAKNAIDAFICEIACELRVKSIIDILNIR